ncbi:molybdopterin-guanine dinucleotide biosynthesis protein B [Pontibacillus litoralis]|uniref:Molybdopterin-guanine dinucleotide biosynthesis protein B n=1 Tax=Pontibacillus litoralis JSM 072002 TaxID=1385512 RepID=A0A0A5G3P3_9BACI|nr:molybdopterin-guanine dinucleotide biosynthesis protein B [Pontibacillus litoralis]KGX87741.1 molybdopterin-guanine dinucleotide biosynthesis protein B [Pontibacillus litoralis JSM 072002]
MEQFPFVVWQVVGYKESGKTTLMTTLVEELQKSGLRVGTLKHHGHGGKPTFCDDDTDSGRHRDAGAIVSGVEGGGQMILSSKQDQWTLEKALAHYISFELDVVLVEGYKHANYPKCVLLKSKEDKGLLLLKNVQCVVEWKGSDCQVSTFSINDEKAYVSWIVAELMKRCDQ